MAAPVMTSPANAVTLKQERKEKEKAGVFSSYQREKNFPKGPSRQNFPYTSPGSLGHMTSPK